MERGTVVKVDGILGLAAIAAGVGWAFGPVALIGIGIIYCTMAAIT